MILPDGSHVPSLLDCLRMIKGTQPDLEWIEGRKIKGENNEIALDSALVEIFIVFQTWRLLPRTNAEDSRCE